MSVVSKNAHYVLCLKDGHIGCEGPPAEIVAGDMLKQIFGTEIRVYGHSHEH